MSVPTAEQETAQHDDFDAAVDAYVEQGQPAAGGETPPARPATPAPADVPAPVAAAPVATPADEPDDDDETLPFDQRFTRAQARETRIKAEAEAERTRLEKFAKDQANGYQGRLKQEQTRAAALEAERDRFKQQADDTNAAINGIWEARIASTTDPEERAAWQAQYDFDRTKREVEAERKQIALEREQQQQQATRVKEEQIGAATEGMRQHVVPSLVGPMEEFATAIGLPIAELADIRATLHSRPMQQMFARMTPEELHTYRNELGEGIFEEIAQRSQAFKTRQAGANRKEAATVYRAEQPVGAGGGTQQRPWEDLDFDEAVDTLFADRSA